MRRRVLVLHSGGMDSTVCLFAAHQVGHEVISLGIDYGQRLAIEMMFAERHCAQLGIRREVVRVQWNKPERDIPLGRRDLRSCAKPWARRMGYLELLPSAAA